MSNIRFAPEAKKLAKQTGLDRLGQSTLQKLDADGDGIVRLRDTQKLVKAAGLTKDGVLGVAERKRIKEVLGGAQNGSSSSAGSSKSPSSAIAAKAGTTSKTRKLEDGYMQLLVQSFNGNIEAKLDHTSYEPNGSVSGSSSGKLVIPGFQPTSIEAVHYNAKGMATTTTGTVPHEGPISDTSTFAAGALLLVADKKRGAVLIDLPSGDVLAGKQPATRDIFSPEKLAKDPTVKAAAKKLGLSPTKLSVDVIWVDASSGFEDKLTSTLALELRLRDGNGKSKKQTFSTYMTGSMKKGLSGLSFEKLERGLERSWGWLYPPSAKASAPKPEDKRKKFDDDNYISNDNGGSEYSAPSSTHTHTGGSEWAAPSNNWTGGGE